MADSIKIGNLDISSFKVGNTDVDAIYLGTSLVYSGDTPTPPTPSYKWLATYSDSHTESAECDSTSAITSGEVTKTNLVAVEIGECVTNISTNTFSGCTSLTSVVIGSGVQAISTNAFEGCTSLSSVTIPNSVTSIGNSAFESCSSLTSITIPDSVTNIGVYAFVGCSNLTSVNIPSGVTIIKSGTFGDCSSLTSIDIPNSVITIGDSAFAGCNNISSVTIGNSVQTIGKSTFSGLKFTSIDIPNSVTSIGAEAFLKCTSLSSVTIPDSVASIGNSAFWSCSGLTTCTIGSGVTSIGYSAFQYCSGLTSIVCNAVTAPSIGTYASIGTYVFDETNNCPIHVPCQGYDTYMTNDAWNAYSSRLQSNVVDYNWTQTSDTICVGGDKYAVEAYQWTCDGLNWNTSSVYTRTGILIESGSSDCQSTSAVLSGPNIIAVSGAVTSVIFEDGGVIFRGASNWRSTGTTTSFANCRISGGTAFSCTTSNSGDIDNVTFVVQTSKDRTKLNTALDSTFKQIYSIVSSGTCTINGTTRYWIRYKYDESSQSSKLTQIEADRPSAGLQINYIGINVADDWQDDLPLPS